MKKTELLLGPPISGEYEEIMFDLPGPWREQEWYYLKFTTKKGEEWVGGFRAKDKFDFLVAELEKSGIVCVVSGGHGYIIDIENKQKIKDLDNNSIIDLISDQETNSFYISFLWGMMLVDEEFNEIDIKVPIPFEEILFKE